MSPASAPLATAPQPKNTAPLVTASAPLATAPQPPNIAPLTTRPGLPRGPLTTSRCGGDGQPVFSVVPPPGDDQPVFSIVPDRELRRPDKSSAASTEVPLGALANPAPLSSAVVQEQLVQSAPLVSALTLGARQSDGSAAFKEVPLGALANGAPSFSGVSQGQSGQSASPPSALTLGARQSDGSPAALTEVQLGTLANGAPLASGVVQGQPGQSAPLVSALTLGARQSDGSPATSTEVPFGTLANGAPLPSFGQSGQSAPLTSALASSASMEVPRVTPSPSGVSQGQSGQSAPLPSALTLGARQSDGSSAASTEVPLVAPLPSSVSQRQSGPSAPPVSALTPSVHDQAALLIHGSSLAVPPTTVDANKASHESSQDSARSSDVMLCDVKVSMSETPPTTSLISERDQNLTTLKTIQSDGNEPPMKTVPSNKEFRAISKVTAIHAASDVQLVQCQCRVDVPRYLYERIPWSARSDAIGGAADGDPPVNYEMMQKFLFSTGNLSQRGVEAGDVVVLVLPNGPELALALIVCMLQCTTVPLDLFRAGEEETIVSLERLCPAHTIVLRAHKIYSGHIERACELANSQLHYILRAGQEAGLFQWADPPLHPNKELSILSAEGVALILHTAGTTAKAKVVPLTARGIYTGAVSIGSGLGLAASDVCLNVMPLTHIGGISCSLLATMFTGGQVICAPGYDTERFLFYLEQFQPTWYYASPTIHKAIISHCKKLNGIPQNRLRFIRSGAATLVHKDAEELANVMSCTVYPTYSMTECMPVAQPPEGYNLSKPGTVGVPISSSLCILGENGLPVRYGETGEVCILGPVVTRGYLGNQEENEPYFFGQADMHGSRWFRTGDTGYLDSDGFLFLTGRKKEIIKRGGELISPFEIEEVLLRHPVVNTAMVFGVPNEFWGEEVAAAVVFKEGYSARVATTPQHNPSTLVGAPVMTCQVLSNKNSASMQKVMLAHRQLKMATAGVDQKDEQPSMQRRPSDLAKEAKAALSMSSMTPKLSSKSSGDKQCSASDLQAFVACQLQPSKVPKQILILDSDTQLPKTTTGKFVRLTAADHLSVSAVDLPFASGASTSIGTCMDELKSIPVPSPVKISQAINGARFLLVCWVMFVHIGDFPDPIHAWRYFSASTTGFLVLAGFILTSSITRPIDDLCSFYRSRIVVAHSLYLFAAMYTLPLMLMGTTPWYPAVAYVLVVVGFNQLAWPWGGIVLHTKKDWLLWPNNPMWFNSVYYFCLLVFPFLYSRLTTSLALNWLAKPDGIFYRGSCGCTISNFCCWPSLGLGGIFTCLIVLEWIVVSWVAEDPLYEWFAYTFPPFWAGVFFLGMLTFNLFEMHRRRSTDSIGLWPHWGALTDGITFYFVLQMGVAAIIGATSEVDRQAAPVISAATGESSVLLHVLGGIWTGPLRLSTGVICVWIYGLAVGEGYTAMLLKNRILVTYFAPSSYAIYLLHWPNARYWMFFVHGFTGPDVSRNAHWVEFLFIALLTIVEAMCVTFFLQEPLTIVFMRFFDIFCCCCSPKADIDDGLYETTLLKVGLVMQALTGAEVDAHTRLDECGLDSFGLSALLGMLRPHVHYVTLSTSEIAKFVTVGDLVVAIDRAVDAGIRNTSSIDSVS